MNMIRRVSVALYAFIMLTFSGCVGLNDWEYDLGNGYEMWHVNAKGILVGYKTSDSSLSIYNDNGDLLGIPKHIVEFSENGVFVGAKVINPDDYEQYRNGDLIPVDYYILNTLEKQVFGPMEEDEFEKRALQLMENCFDDWQVTSPAPKGVIYP